MLLPFEDQCAAYGTLTTIRAAFEDEAFVRSSEPLPGESPETRRGTFHDYADRCDLADPEQVSRLLRVFETILSWVPDSEPYYPGYGAPLFVEHPESERIRKHLRRDGYDVDDDGRIVSAAARVLVQLPLDQLRDASAIQEHLDRLSAAADADPALAISSAKALLEATCKLVLRELGEDYEERADVPALARAVQIALKVHPEKIAPTAKGRETILRTLSNLSQVATGLAELRNEYGPDHGRTRPSVGLRPRHAHLAVGAAQTYCRFLLETLRDRRAATTTS